MSLNEFSKERDDWDSLAVRDPSGSIFDTWEWLHSYWTSRREQSGVPLLLEMIREDGPKCAAAFKIRRTGGGSLGVLGRRTLEFLSQGALTDYNTVLISPDSQVSDVSAATCEYLLHRSPSIDYVNLKEIRSGQRTLAILGKLGTRARLKENSRNYFLPLVKDWEEQSARFPSHFRNELGRVERSIMRDYPSTEFFEEPEPTEKMLDSMFDLHRQRMQFLSKTSALTLEENISFHKQFVSLASKKGWVRLFRLVVAGEEVAAVYGFAFNQRFCPYAHGFVSDFAKYSPASILFGKAIRSSIGEGLSEFDFLRGEAEFKLLWTKESRSNHGLRMVTRRPLSILKKVLSDSATLARGHS